MCLLLVKICAVAAVNLVADGADAQAANYITEPARALRHDPSIKRLRAQQNADEERVNDVPDALDKIMKEYISTNSVLPDVVTSALESGHFNDIFNKMSSNKAIKGRETDVTAAIRDAYAKFKEMEYKNYMDKLDLGISLDITPDIPHSAVESVQPTRTQPVHLPLAQPVRPTLAESGHPVLAASVHPTLADPVSARLKGKGPAEAIGGQLDPKVSIHPTYGLSLSKLDKEQADKILSESSKWIEIVKSRNEKNPTNPIFVVDTLAKKGVDAKKLVKALFSFGLPENMQGNMNLVPEELFRRKKYIAITFHMLTKYWLQHDTDPGDLLPIFGLGPTLPTGYDFARLVEWMKYANTWLSKKSPGEMRYTPQIVDILRKRYTAEQLSIFLDHSDDKHGDLDKRMMKFLDNLDNEQPVSPNSPKKRKRDTKTHFAGGAW